MSWPWEYKCFEFNTFRKPLKHKRMMKMITNFFVSLQKNLVCKSLSWGQMKINVARLMGEISKSKWALVFPTRWWPWRRLWTYEFDASNGDGKGQVQAGQVDFFKKNLRQQEHLTTSSYLAKMKANLKWEYIRSQHLSQPCSTSRNSTMRKSDKHVRSCELITLHYC